MGILSIKEITVKKLDRIETYGGDVLHVMKSNDAEFAGFGEAYFSSIECDVIKAWKRHKNMTMNLVVPQGNVMFVFHKEGEEFRVEKIGDGNYARITVPPGIWFGFKGLNSPNSLVLNIANVQHSDDEEDRGSIDHFAYPWFEL